MDLHLKSGFHMGGLVASTGDPGPAQEGSGWGARAQPTFLKINK